MKLPKLTLLISAATVALYMVYSTSLDAVVWQHNSSEVWRWVSGHFMHVSATHLFWNLSAFIVLGTMIEQTHTAHILLGLLVGGAAINLYLATGYGLSAYAGLSGVLNTLLVIALYHQRHSDAYRNAALLTLVGSLLKIILELRSGESLVAHLAWPPVPEAHLIGWLAGFTLCIILSIYNYKPLLSAQEV